MITKSRTRIDRIIDALIRKLWDTRTERGLSQSAVCPDMRHQKISIWESGTNVPGLKNFITWADALGFEVKLVPKDVPDTTPVPAPITTIWFGCVCSYTWYPSMSNGSTLSHRMVRRGVPGCPRQHEDDDTD